MNAKSCDQGISKKEQSQWLMITPESSLEASEDHASTTLCKLRHPHTDQAAMFMFNPSNTKVYEVLKFKEKYRSWLINDTVQEDGGLYVTTDMDPVFLILPYLIKAHKSGKFIPLEQLVTDEEYPECHRLCGCDGVKELRHVADMKGPDDLRAYRYNGERTLVWLKLKVEKVAESLQEEKIDTQGGSVAATYVKSNRTVDASKDDYVRHAYGIISDYLPTTLAEELKNLLGIKDAVHEKPKMEEPAAKRTKKGKEDPIEDYSIQNKKNDQKKMTRTTLAQKQLEKVDKAGMKSISSFFAAKPKK